MVGITVNFAVSSLTLHESRRRQQQNLHDADIALSLAFTVWKKEGENLKIIHMNSIVFDKLGIFLDGKIKKEMGEKS